MVKINNDLRAKVFVRMQARAVYDLFHFGKYLTPKENSLNTNFRQNMLKNMRKDNHINELTKNSTIKDLNKNFDLLEGKAYKIGMFHKTNGPNDKSKIVFDISTSFNPKNRGELFELVWHELMHEQAGHKFNKNDLVLANASSEYLNLVNNNNPSIQNKLLKKRFDKKTIELIQFSMHPEIVSILKNNQHKIDVEYDPVLNRKSCATIGEKIGEIATKIEHNIGIPGIGLIFIREVGRGRQISEINKDLIKHKPKYFKELTKWFSRHRSIREYLLMNSAKKAVGKNEIAIKMIKQCEMELKKRQGQKNKKLSIIQNKLKKPKPKLRPLKH